MFAGRKEIRSLGRNYYWPISNGGWRSKEKAQNISKREKDTHNKNENIYLLNTEDAFLKIHHLWNKSSNTLSNCDPYSPKVLVQDNANPCVATLMSSY